MKKGRLYNKQEIEIISKSAIGKSISEIANEDIVTIPDADSLNKGSLGQLVEQFLFGITNNNDSEPDFMPAGIELKVTPYKKLKDNKLTAKERLVLNIINFKEEYKNDFKDSHFWMKNNTIQLLWYLWEQNKEPKDYKITHENLLELSKNEDLAQIEKDWNYIVKKIKAGKAHELSEADTMYLGACTKGNNSLSTREQPFSDFPAMQRAFCFKKSYMTQLVRKYIGDYSDVEKVLNNSNNTFDEYVNSIISRYINKPQKELQKEFNIKTTPKNLNSILINRMFNLKGNLSDTEEFQKANIIPKSIRIEENGRIIESMSFPYFRYTDIVNQEWETSELRDYLETTKYMFFVFKKVNGEYIFKGIKLWNMPETDIETWVMDMWKKTYNTIKTGNIVRCIVNGKRKTNFVGMSENEVCHVRPHGRNAADTCKLPVPDKLTGATSYTKHCFWINNSYIKKIFEEFN